MHHILKIESNFYDTKVAGEKLFEIRNNSDRGFQKGDTVSYKIRNPDVSYERWDTQDGVWEITYVLSGFAIDKNFVVFGERPVEK